MVLLGIGSNLNSNFGNRFMNIDIAISYLEQYEIKLIKKSSYYESPSYPDPSKPKFINVVVEVSTSLPPEDLASVLIYVEEKLESQTDSSLKSPTKNIEEEKKEIVPKVEEKKDQKLTEKKEKPNKEKK